MGFLFIGMLVAYLLGNIFIFIRGLQAFGALVSIGRAPLFVVKCLFSTFFWVAAFALPISLFARNVVLPEFLHRFLYILGSVWLVFTLYMVLALLVAGLFRKFRHRGTVVAFCCVVILLLCGYVNYRHPRVRELTIDLTGSAVERDTVGKKSVSIVAVSDVHLGYSTDKKSLHRYVDMINSLAPDIVLIGGDLIDNSIVPLRQQRMDEELGQLKAPMGIFMVPGNHEYISGMDAVGEFLANTPVVLLRDTSVLLPCGLRITGRDDRSNRNRLPVSQLLKEDDFPEILMDHQPYELAQKDSLGVDIQFSGHTHRGQVWPMSLLVDRLYEQSYGYRKWANSHVIVSTGLSLWGPPFRIGTSSEMWLLKLYF